MREPNDEPELKGRTPPAKTRSNKKILRTRISRLLDSQNFAILATQGRAQPYASIIGFTVSRDLRFFFFATPKTTRKYHLLRNSGHVAVQIDNRPQNLRRFMNIESVTATGVAREIQNANELQRTIRALMKRHPYLASFYGSPTCAIIRVRVIRYFHVYRFQKVSQWTPTRLG